MSIIDSDVELRLTPEMAGVRMTPEEFDAVTDCDELYKFELVHGVLVATPPPSEGERGPNEQLGYFLRCYQEHHPQGSSLDLTLPESEIRTADSRRRADRAVWAGLGRTPSVRRDMPTIAIEFVSKGKRDFQRDYVDKRDEYTAAGLQEYWIIDRFRRCMTGIRRDGDAFTEIVAHEDEVYTTPQLPGFELPLAKLLAVADELEEANSAGDSEQRVLFALCALEIRCADNLRFPAIDLVGTRHVECLEFQSAEHHVGKKLLLWLCDDSAWSSLRIEYLQTRRAGKIQSTVFVDGHAVRTRSF